MFGVVPKVLWERRRAGRWLGTSDNYLPVVVESEAALARRLSLVHLRELVDGTFVGSLTPAAAARLDCGAAA